MELLFTFVILIPLHLDLPPRRYILGMQFSNPDEIGPGLGLIRRIDR
jgi:hypothetical protein